MKIGEEVVHSSRRSSKSYLCTESGQPQHERAVLPRHSLSTRVLSRYLSCIICVSDPSLTLAGYMGGISRGKTRGSGGGRKGPCI